MKLMISYGEPVITIGSEVLEAMNGLWKQCMIVKVLRRNISIAVLSKRLREMWKPRGAMHVMDLPRQFFMIRFEREDEYIAALTGGPWRAFGSYLMVQAWSPEFDPLRDEIVTTPVWVRLSNIPVNFYHKAILLGIAKGLGKPIKVDVTTLNFERARFARVCVEVNLQKPLKGTVMINGERYFVSYEGLTNICSLCGIFGHAVHVCPKKVTETPVGEIVASGSENGLGEKPGSDGFTMVRRRGRRLDSPPSTVVFAAGGSQANLGRNLQEITQRNDIANTTVSNRYGSLDAEGNPPTFMDGLISSDANKENVSAFPKVVRKDKGTIQKLEGRSNGPVGKNLRSVKEGPTERTPSVHRAAERFGPKSKSKVNRPMRGLIFGPTKGELGMSESGKRLRVEREGMGRAGGVFDNGRSTQSSDVNAMKYSEEGMEISLQKSREGMVSKELVIQEDHRRRWWICELRDSSPRQFETFGRK